MTDHLQIIATYVYGVKEWKPVEYTLYRMSDGSGKLFSPFMSLCGEYDDLLLNARIAGMRVTLA